MALHGIPHTLVQLGNRISLGKGRFSYSAREVASLGASSTTKMISVISWLQRSFTISGRAVPRIERNPQVLASDLITLRLGARMARMGALDIVQKTHPLRWK
jgi:hypothetical protein